MELVPFAVHVVLAISVTVAGNNIGYFWHLTDIHWDQNYGTSAGSCQKPVASADYGSYLCDAPWSLVQSAVQTMLSIRDDVEFILWTGDSLSSSTKMDKMAALANLTNLMGHVFSSHFVFPVIGHDDPYPLTNDRTEPFKGFSDLWKHWLPTEALDTFKKGGYYTIEQSRKRLRLVALNTNLATGSGAGEDPAGQWTWLEAVLNNSRAKNETVYLVGHTPPGLDERAGGYAQFPMATALSYKYLSLVKQFADVITGQFFGCLHSDTFRVVYDDKENPVSRIFIAPSISPRRSSAGFSTHNNPGFRLYKILIDTGQVVDYSQYYLDLTRASEVEEPEWQLLYNFTDYYGLSEPSARELHVLAENFTEPPPDYTEVQYSDDTFSRYLQASWVNSSGTWDTAGSAHAHYCAITRLQAAEYQNCLAATPAPLAFVTAPAPVNAAPRLYSLLPTALLYSLLQLLRGSR